MGKKEEIRVIVINRPTKEESEQKTKELCEFLEKTWHTPPKTQ
jgi:hypothetical protein